MNLGLRLALEAEGLSSDDIAAVDQAIPALQRLDEALTSLDPIVRKVWPDLQPGIPIVEKAYPDFVAVLPVVRRLLQLAKGG